MTHSHRFALWSAALSLLLIANAVQAQGVTYRVTVVRDAATVINQTKHVELGAIGQLQSVKDVHLRGAACHAGAGGVREEVDGVVHSGVTIRIRPAVLPSGVIRTAVTLADARFVQAVAIAAGGCTGETPAMLKFDSSASFDLGTHGTGTLQVGAYTVHVKVIAAPKPARAASSRDFAT